MTDGRKTAKPKRRWIGNVAAVAAIAIILFFAVPNTVGAESVFDVLIRWTESVFEFLKPGENNDPPVEYIFQTDNPGLQQLYDKVVEMGITEPVVPMWLPEGYELVELKEAHLPEKNKVCAHFANKDEMILLTYLPLPKVATEQYEKNDGEVEVFETAKMRCYIFTNEEYFSVTWIVNGFECLINTNMNKDNLLRILNSIYLGG